MSLKVLSFFFVTFVEPLMQRFYYSEPISEFLARPAEYILGCMDQVNEFDLTMEQRGAWVEEFDIMNRVLAE